MKLPHPTSITRILAVIVLFLVGPALAQEKEPQPVERLSTPPAAHSDPAEPETVSVFAGQEFRCRWLIREPADEPLRILLDQFQMLSATVAPMEEDIVLAENAMAEPGKPLEVVYPFDVPESDRPLRYLLKLWIESGDKKRAAATLIVRAVPPDLLSRFKGETISFFGFDSGVAAWRDVLEEAGVILKKLDHAPDRKTPGVSFVHVSDPVENPPAKPARLAGDQRVIFFEATSPIHTAAVFRQAGDGWLITTPMKVLETLSESPKAQEFLIHLLTFEKTQPTLNP